MSSYTKVEELGNSKNVEQTANEHPWWVGGFGVLAVVTGFLAIAAAFWTTVATVVLFGALLLVGGIAQMLDAGTNREGVSLGWRLACGALAAIVGAMLVFDPVGGAVGLTLLLGAFFVVQAVMRLVMATEIEGPARGWLITSGLIDLVLGALILMQWPASGAWIIGLFVGLDLVFTGISMIMLAALRPRLAS